MRDGRRHEERHLDAGHAFSKICSQGEIGA